MNQPDSNSQYVRRVVLPSGRAIEVVYFENLAEAAATEPLPTRERRPLKELQVCPECDRELVYPVEWSETSPTHWEVLLRCPNCEWSDIGVFDQPTVDRFDDELDRGTERPPEAPQPLLVAAAGERAQPARGLEQPRGLEVAAALVAPARDRG